MTSRWKLVQHLPLFFFPLLGLLFGCASLRQNTAPLPDAVRAAGTPIVLTREAQAAATDAALAKQLEGFEARRPTPSGTGEPAAVRDGAMPEATRDAMIEAQLTKAPTMAAFLTRLATTPMAEETPSPPPGCSGGCISYPTWCEPPVKGKIVTRGQRVYYLPDDEAYAEQQMDPDQGDFYFCTAEEAEAAGFQRADS